MFVPLQFEQFVVENGATVEVIEVGATVEIGA
jgi:hypothetical protein